VGPAIRRDGEHPARVNRTRKVGSESVCCKRRISIRKIEIAVAGARYTKLLRHARSLCAFAENLPAPVDSPSEMPQVRRHHRPAQVQEFG